MPTAEEILKDKDFRSTKTEKQLEELERFIKSGKEKPLKEAPNEQISSKTD